jgi:hypothetical protein
MRDGITSDQSMSPKVLKRSRPRTHLSPSLLLCPSSPFQRRHERYAAPPRPTLRPRRRLNPCLLTIHPLHSHQPTRHPMLAPQCSKHTLGPQRVPYMVSLHTRSVGHAHHMHAQRAPRSPLRYPAPQRALATSPMGHGLAVGNLIISQYSTSPQHLYCCDARIDFYYVGCNRRMAW